MLFRWLITIFPLHVQIVRTVWFFILGRTLVWPFWWYVVLVFFLSDNCNLHFVHKLSEIILFLLWSDVVHIQGLLINIFHLVLFKAALSLLLHKLITCWPCLFCCEKSWIILDLWIISLFVVDRLNAFGQCRFVCFFFVLLLIKGWATRWFPGRDDRLRAWCWHNFVFFFLREFYRAWVCSAFDSFYFPRNFAIASEMQKSLCIKVVSSDVTFQMNLVIPHVRHFRKHVTSFLSPCDLFRVYYCNLSQQCVWIWIQQTLCWSVQHHELVAVGKLRFEDTLEEFLYLGVLCRWLMLQVLQNTDEARHPLWSN